MRADKTVVIAQRRLTHYRVPFFEAAREQLEKCGIRLILVHGQPAPSETAKQDAGELPWAVGVKNRYWRAMGIDFAWQPLPNEAVKADLFIVTQESRMLSNYPLLLRRHIGGPKVAFWGHGVNFQSTAPHGLRERWKRFMLTRVDWWFAYTQRTFDIVKAAGFPPERITVLNNAVDTTELRRQRETVTAEETLALRRSLGFGDGPVGVYVGSLYAGKRLDFLFAAAEAIRREVTGFHLLVLGDGPERDKVRVWCGAHPWAHWAGARFGREKAVCLSIAQVMLNPGLVGLGILDAFACGVPVLTTDCGIHSPEIAYLENGRNGVMTANVLEEYAAAAVRLLRDPEALGALRAGCAKSVAEYTVENMARNFADGVTRALVA